MKTLKFLLFAMLALSMSMNMTCSDDDTPGQQPDDLREQNLLKSKLLGEWVAPDQENSYVYAFADDDTIYIKSREGDTV
ncbi:MAG: hypothetical protein LBK47_05640, partial [Prevotellaceae bacterium]|nr:hypothetical protein [Prevotellaceae bacterium]